MTKWIERLTAAPEMERPGELLYAGEHWSIVRRLAGVDGAVKVRVWIASAGYGLVPYHAPLKPYSATFDRSHVDGVPINSDQWWGRMADWPGPSPGQPRRLADLAEAHPRSALLLVLSATYLAACQGDALDAASALRRRGQFAVISSGTSRGRLAEHTLPADARLQEVVGGSRQSLNARIAEHVLASNGEGFSVRKAHDRLANLLRAQPAIEVYDRHRLTDEQIQRFIADQMSDGKVACTPLLARLRSAGYACEQSRFRELYAGACS